MTFAKKLAEHQERRAAEREERFAQRCTPSRAITPGSYAGATAEAAPKSEPYRDPVLLELARGRPCLLCRPGGCICSHGSTVACHSNLGIHGKAKGRKADDCYTVWGGDTAHYWLDFGKADRAMKTERFLIAHANQVLAWRLIAADPKEPERFRAAARRALERLNATTIGETA
jgi:hypothetical protein